MSRDLTIRLLGRPQVSSDKRTGFSKVSRRYVVQGPRATLAGIVDSTNPLFLPYGSTDEEFTDYYLIEQTLAPASGTLDKAYLVREFLQISTSAIQEAYTQTNDLIRVRKRFAVLRNNDTALGYGTLWAKHPSQASTYAEDPWEYAPAWIRSATPGSKNYNVDNADTDHGFGTDIPQVGSGSLGTFAGAIASSGNWMEGYSVMTQAGSGLDVWTVEWVTHAAPYWILGTGSGNRNRTSSVNVVGFDGNGLYTSESLASSGSVSYTTRAMTYNFFVRANSIPSNLAEIGGGSASVSFSPTVSYDYAVTDKEDKTTYFRNIIKNSVWGGNNSLSIDGKNVGSVSGNSLILDFTAEPSGKAGSDGVIPFKDSDLANFRGALVKSIKGNISWTMTKAGYSWSSSSGTFGQTKTSITPLFSKGSEKIWKVAITYVGG